MGLLNGIPWIVGILFLLLINTGIIDAQRRTSRLTNTRTFGINTKSNAPGSEFDCPEEFGYYPHPTDCTQYYVCVFGGALLESCTGGLMYSHELQTCDWPRNVGCEVVDATSQQQPQSVAPTQSSRDVTPRVLQIKSQQSQQQQQQIQQQTTIGPQRVRYQSPVTTVSPQTLQQIPSVVQQQAQQQQSQRTLARQQQISSIPQPEFPAPNPIITSRGQPKSLLESQEDIAKLYAEAHDTLPPAEEEESDRQQRVYRGQPSTLGQVQRDRDGIIHHSNVNAIPTHGKIGSFAFGSQIAQFSIELQDLDDTYRNADKHLTDRKKRDVAENNVTSIMQDITTLLPDMDHELEAAETDVLEELADTQSTLNSSDHTRSSRQLRPGKYHSTWQFQPNFHLLPHLTGKSFRSGFAPNVFTPYRTSQEPESSHFYKPNQNVFSSSIKLPFERPSNFESGSANFNLSPPGFNSGTSNFNSGSSSFNLRPSKLTTFNDFKPSTFFGLQSSHAVSESPPAFNAFRPIPNSNGLSHAVVEAFHQHQHRQQNQKHNDRLPDNFSYFHINQGPTPPQGYETPSPVLSPPNKVTPKGQFIAPSTVGGFYNNNGNSDVSPKSKKVSHFSIQEPPVTTESSYFAYNILQNKKMREYYATTTTESPLTTMPAVSTTPDKIYYATSSPAYYPKDTLEKLTPPSTVFKFRIPDSKKAVPDKSGFFITQAFTTTKRPFVTTKTKPIAAKKPILPIPIPAGSFDFEKFVSGIRQSHIAQVDPSIMETLNFFKLTMIRKNLTQVSTTTNPVSFTTSSNSHRFSSTTVRPTYEKEESTAFIAPTKRPKGYESFIKSIPKKTNHSLGFAFTQKPAVSSPDSTDDLSETDSDEYYYDDNSGGKEYDYDIIPPSEKPPYMPMSETMPPKLPRPTNNSPVRNHKTTESHLSSYAETTTSASSVSSEFASDSYSKPAKIPSFINFPPDIFQRIPAMTDIREKLKNMTFAYSTTQTLTQTKPTAAASTLMTTTTPSTTSPSTSIHTTTVPTTTTRKIYTIRPRTRVNQAWKPKKVSNNVKRPEHQQILNEEKYKQSTTPQPSNIFVQQPQQQQRQKPVAERQNTRNTYYNTSNQSYDPATYDSFYSVYDDDVELYRDVEYNNQQQQPQTQYTPSQRGRPQPAVQSTYRPEIVTTPSPQVPVRETYVSKQQPQQQQTAQQQPQDSSYNRPSLSYSSEYDDALISQIDDDQTYNQPARNPPARGDRYDSNSISDSYSSIRTANPARFAPIFLPTTLPAPTTTTTIVYRPTTTPSTTPSTTTSTTTTYRPTTVRTTESTTISTTTSTSTTTTTTTSRPITTTTSTTTTTTSATTEEPTTKSTRSIQNQEGDNTSNSTASNSESIVITLTATASQRNRNLSADGSHTTSTSARTTTNTSSTFTAASNDDSELTNFNYSDSQQSYFRPNSTPARIRNVQILNEAPPPDFFDLQSTYSQTLDPLNTTSTELEQFNKTDNEKTISFSLSSGFSTAEKPTPRTTSEKTSYLGFQVTNAEPQGFRLPQIGSSSARTPSVIAIPEEKLQNKDSFKFSLSSGLGYQNKEKSSSKGTVEEVPLPIYSRSRDDGLKRETTRIKVDPTTYAPARNWRHSRTNVSPLANDDSNFLSDQFDNKEVDSIHSYRRVRPNDFNLKRNDKEYNPAVEVDRFQGFTTRALTFKDSLNKNSDASGSSRFVSPFKSLETILDEQEDLIPEDNIKPLESSPRATSTEAEPTTSQKPFRSYFIITQPPKPPATTSTTTEETTTEPSLLSSSTPTTTTHVASTTTTTTTRTSNTPAPIETLKERQLVSTSFTFRPVRKQERSGLGSSFRGRSRYTFSYRENNLESDEPTTYSPKHRFSTSSSINSTPVPPKQTKSRFRGFTSRTSSSEGRSSFEFAALRANEPELVNNPSYLAVENETYLDTKSGDDTPQQIITSSGQELTETTERPSQFFSNYRNLGSEKTPTFEDAPVEPIQRNVEANEEHERFRATVEMPEFNIPTEREIKFALDAQEAQEVFEYQNQDIYGRRQPGDSASSSELSHFFEVGTESPITTQKPTAFTQTSFTTKPTVTTTTTTYTSTSPVTNLSSSPPISESKPFLLSELDSQEHELISTSTSTTTTAPRTTTTRKTTTTAYLLPPRASRVNSALKSSIAASSRKKSPASAYTKCSDNSPNAKCNEIPSRTRTRGGVHYNSGSNSQNSEREPSATQATTNRGTHPPRTRPTLKSKGSIVSKAAEFVDIYKNPPTRPEPLYPQPTPDKTAAKCRKDVCLLPDCSCGGKDIPADLPVESLPQIVLLTFDDSVNDLNKQLYTDLFEKGRTNPNGCPITATFYVSHEWTDYSQVQNLYADGHEMASHTVSHSFGEQFSQKKWTREIAGQREILSAYGGVKLSDVRGMRAPFLSIGGNKMFKMLYDSNFTYDSSMPVYENRPPSWPYTLDYKIFHDCMIPPCPTKSYPGVWEVPMVMWQDLNGGRCSMGDACANPADAEGVTKMLMKNFERHYTTNRAPFGLFYHAAWFTQPHHKEGFIKFLDSINAMDDVWIVTNWQMLQWVRDPTPLSRIKQFQPFQCDYSDRPKRCNNPKVCNLWHKSGVRYMRTCQPCPDIYPWTGKTGIRSSRIDNDIED